MPYAKRDDAGKIVALHSAPSDDATEQVAPSDPAVLDFMLEAESSEASMQYLLRSDAELLRVVEDVVNLLVDKNLIMFTELPEVVQRKLEDRERARESLRDESGLMVDRDDIL